MPRREYDSTEYEGIALVQNVFRSELKWGFREQPPPDAGIDVHAETVVDGQLSGKLLSIQVKAGSTYLEERTDVGFVFRGDREHLQYWLEHSLPVIIALCDLQQGRVYWQHVTKDKAEPTGQGWKIVVPFDQILGPATADMLQRIAHREYPITRLAVPFARDPQFVGREEDLAELHAMLGGGRTVGVIGLTGIGGIGKTQLAVEYAHRHAASYPGGIYWVNAEKGLSEGLARCAGLAGLGDPISRLANPRPRRDLVNLLYHWLWGHPDSLLVLDNLQKVSYISDPILDGPALRSLPCRILLTTRSRTWDVAGLHRKEVCALPRWAGMQLLLCTQSRQEALFQDHRDHQVADEICGMLGDLPLALVQVGAYLRKWPDVTLGAYRERLAREGTLPSADDTPIRSAELFTCHEIGVRRVLEESTAGLSSEAVRLLRAIGKWTGQTIVEESWLAAAAALDRTAATGRPSRFAQALSELDEACLVNSLPEGRLWVHPLVRDFACALAPLDNAARLLWENADGLSHSNPGDT